MEHRQDACATRQFIMYWPMKVFTVSSEQPQVAVRLRSPQAV